MTSIKIVCPPIEALKQVDTVVKCSFEGCTNTFTTKSNLNMHVVKYHKHAELKRKDINILYKFHCPVESCVYSVKSEKHFTHMKHLKQHFLKVHAEKTFICEKCNKGFPTLAIKNSHKNICGVTFSCSECSCSYLAYEALLTHSKRKNHKILPKSHYIKNTICGSTVSVSAKPKKNEFILPKTIGVPILIINMNKRHLVSKEIAVQTDVNKSPTQETQTINNIINHAQKTTETQTTSGIILREALQRPLKKKCKVETYVSRNINEKCEMGIENGKLLVNTPRLAATSYNQNEFAEVDKNKRLNETYDVLNDIWNDSGTQTSPVMKRSDGLEFLESDRQYLNCGSQTNLNHIINDDCFIDQSYANRSGMDGLISNHKFYDAGRLCSIETQTDLNNLLVDDNSSFDRMLQSNMYTQTCNDSLFDLGFNDIETQTAWPEYRDMFVSTETQTSLYTAELNHTETQTDLAIKKLTDFS